MLREPTAGSGKPRHGHEKHCPAARIEAAKKTSARGRNRAGTARKDREEVEVLRGSLHGYSVVVLEGHERAHQSELGFEQQNRFRNSREIQRIEKKLSERALTQRKARAREEPSPGPPASETDAGPPGHQPRGGAPARPRLSRGQEGPTGPELGFEQRNRFRSLRDTRRTEKKVLRKPPAGGPVVGQTFKYIY